MSLRHTLNLAHKALSHAEIDHALIGGLALATLGINRATGDVDLLIDGQQKDLAKKVLQDSGFILKHDSSEVLHFEGPGFLDVLLANRPLSLKMLESSKIIPSIHMKCLAAEDIIGLKIQAYINNPKREYQDKADIRSLMEKDPNLDWEKIKVYADIFDQWTEIQKIKARS